ncbi:ATP phosphoribosyltransferase [Oleiharenicola lentus]|uniref:ATP phosphoribosyltransferase n=1 Tax=Oleiharenicola lentus TaxID=2508720 RepID=A0A4Q1C6N9_9BACT|nr:ATP phosphoribosyltransferase [Oleiharenicola lentus]RXK54456.1 ATP phosphoribosyltransferase [Oleiharenicola lentus]
MPPANLPKDRLRLAVQKSGRLHTDSMDLLKACGIKIKSPKEKLLLHADNFPLDLLFVRDDDIPQLVMDGVCDLGIVGQNVLEESALERGTANAYVSERVLDFGGCRLAIALPEERPYASVKDLAGLRIATSYPQLTKRYLAQQGVSADVVTLSGSVEIAPRLGLADVICDLVSSGSTLEANKLRAVETIFKSTAALIRNARPLNAEKAHALEIILRRLDGVQKAAGTKYIMLHAPKANLAAIKALLPGSENPTVLPLAGDDSKVALHAVCSEDVFWETMDALKKAGASSILVLPIEKMML